MIENNMLYALKNMAGEWYLPEGIDETIVDVAEYYGHIITFGERHHWSKHMVYDNLGTFYDYFKDKQALLTELGMPCTIVCFGLVEKA